MLIADVSGKGTSAALYMAELKGLVLSLSQIYLSPRQLLIEVNRIISDNLDTRSFITMTYAVIDLKAGRMTYARAGHTPLIFMRSLAAGETVRVLVPSGLVVGLHIPGAHEKFIELLEEESLDLNTGDVIVLYTDGVSEAMNSDADLFGDSRLSRIVEEHGHLESGELRERILREIESFVGAADQHDDMTMILMKVEQPSSDGQDPRIRARRCRTPAWSCSRPPGVHDRSRHRLPHAVAGRSGSRPRPARSARHRHAGAVGHAADAVSDGAARAAAVGGGRRRRPRRNGSSRAIARSGPARASSRSAPSSSRSNAPSATASAIAACSSTR